LTLLDRLDRAAHWLIFFSYFIVVMDALGFMLNDSKYGIKVFKLPDGKWDLDASLADDTSLYLLGTIRNLNKMYKILDTYCITLGSRVSWDKTNAIWTAKTARPFDWGAQQSLKWVQEGTCILYLGPLIGVNLSKDTNMGPLLELIFF